MQMSVLECRFSGLLPAFWILRLQPAGHLCFSPLPPPPCVWRLSEAVPHEAKGAGRNLPELTPRRTSEMGVLFVLVILKDKFSF